MSHIVSTAPIRKFVIAPLGLAALLALAVLAPAAAAQTSDSFTGTWEGTIKPQLPDGTEGNLQPIVLTLTQKGKSLTGTAGPGAQQQVEIAQGAVADGKATFEVQLPNAPPWKFSLAIVKDRLQGDMVAERDGEIRGRAKVDAAKVEKAK